MIVWRPYPAGRVTASQLILEILVLYDNSKRPFASVNVEAIVPFFGYERCIKLMSELATGCLLQSQ